MSSKNSHHIFSVAHVIEPTKVAINGGIENNLAKGDKFLLFRLGPEIFDPETLESLGSLELVIGYAEIVHVQDKISILDSTERRRLPDKKRIFEYGSNSFGVSASTMARLTGSRDPKEEIVPGENIMIPFKNVAIGDKAKKIG